MKDNNMKRYLNLFVFALSGFILSIVLTGCSAEGPQFDGFAKAPNNKGTLYIYRPSTLGASGIKYSIYNVGEEKKIGDLRNGGYVKYISKPGKLAIGLLYDPDGGSVLLQTVNLPQLIGSGAASFFIDSPSAPIYNVNIKPNGITCIRWDASNLKGGLVDEATCRKEIINTQLSY